MEIDDKKIPLIRQNLNFIERGIAELENFVRDLEHDVSGPGGVAVGVPTGFTQFLLFVEGLEFVKRIKFAAKVIREGETNIDDEIELLEEKLKEDSE